MAAAASCSPALILLAWSIARERPLVRPIPTRRELRDSAIVGALLLGGGMGCVAFGEQTVPSGITALLIATDAGLGRDPRRDLPRRAAAAPGRHRDRRRVRRRRDPRRPAASRRQRVRSTRSASPPACSPRSPGRPVRCSPHIAPSLPGRPLVATGLQMVLGGLVLVGHGHGHRRARAPSTSARSPAIRSSRSLYLTVIGSLLAFTVYGWMLRAAPLPLVADIRLRQPGRRGHPRRDRPRRGDRAADGRRRRRDHRGRGRADRHRARPDGSDPAAVVRVHRPESPPSPTGKPATDSLTAEAQAFGRSQPCAGHGSQRSGRSSR